MPDTEDPFIAARSALSSAPVAPTRRVDVDGPNLFDLPDDFLCELARFWTRFNRLRAALASQLQGPHDIDAMELTDAQARRLTSLLSRRSWFMDEVPVTAQDYMGRMRQLSLIAQRLYEHEWRVTAGRMAGYPLENWPPGGPTPPSAANDASPPRERLADRVSLDEIKRFSRHCAQMHMAIF